MNSEGSEALSFDSTIPPIPPISFESSRTHSIEKKRIKYEPPDFKTSRDGSYLCHLDSLEVAVGTILESDETPYVVSAVKDKI